MTKTYTLSAIQLALLRAIHQHCVITQTSVKLHRLASELDADDSNVYQIAQRLVRKGYLRRHENQTGTTQLTPLGLSALGVCPVPIAIWNPEAQGFQGETECR